LQDEATARRLTRLVSHNKARYLFIVQEAPTTTKRRQNKVLLYTMTKFTTVLFAAAFLLVTCPYNVADAFSSVVFIPRASTHQATTASTRVVLSAVEDKESGDSIATAVDSVDEDDTSSTTTTMTPQKRNELLYIPQSLDEMIKQASSAMEDAMKLGKNRQIMRILLPRSADNDQLLQYYETSNVESSTNADLILCPTDETWQGGIMQLYRAASYASQEILRYVEFDVRDEILIHNFFCFESAQVPCPCFWSALSLPRLISQHFLLLSAFSHINLVAIVVVFMIL
jgi:hypothetical protein